MKPVGLRDPRTGKIPWAVVQLRKENLRADSYNLVGFQNHLRFGEQARVLRLIPGLENAHFLRYGQIHRNTYICAPLLLDGFWPRKTCVLKSQRRDTDASLNPSSSRARSAASKVTPNPSPQVCLRGFTRLHLRAVRSPPLFPAQLPSVH